MEKVPVSWLSEIWHFLFGWPAVDILIGAACVAIAVLEPPIIATIIPDLRKWAIAGAVVAFTFLTISGKFYHDGIAFKQAEWDSALAKQVEQGEADRAAAVAAEPAATSDRSVFNDDPDNRDRSGADGIKPKGPVRWLASHHLFGKR